MKKFYYLVIVMTFFFFTACERNVDVEPDDDNTNSEYVENDSDYEWDETTATLINLKNTTIEVVGDGATVDDTKVYIQQAGTFIVNGTLDNGQIVVQAEEDTDTIKLILDNVDITCTNSSPIFVEKSKKTIIILADDSENKVTDGSSYSGDEENATIFSKSDLAISGTGKLIVNANYNDAITSKDGLIIRDGEYDITSVDDGIRGKDYLVIKNGTFTIDAKGDALKSDNEESGYGYISVIYGDFNISAGGDGFQAYNNLTITNGIFNISNSYNASSAKAIKAGLTLRIDKGEFHIECVDDAIHSNNEVVINDGTFEISTEDDGIHADASITINNGSIAIEKSYEGVESKYITFEKGSIWVTSSDDSFNSTAGSRTESNDGSCTYINGGYIVLNASNGDGLDSNGSIEMTDGTVIIHGPSSQPEVMIDYNGTYNISGGFLVSSGSSSNMTQAPSNSSSQNSLKIFFSSSNPASTIFHLEDSEGNEIVTFQPEHQYQSVVFSSSELQSGETYSIYTGGSSTGTETSGLYTNGEYTPGSLYQSFTVSSTVTTVGSSGQGGGPGRP